MASERRPSANDRRRIKEDRARDAVGAASSDAAFMRGVRQGLEDERRGEGTHFKDLKRKRARR